MVKPQLPEPPLGATRTGTPKTHHGTKKQDRENQASPPLKTNGPSPSRGARLSSSDPELPVWSADQQGNHRMGPRPGSPPVAASESPSLSRASLAQAVHLILRRQMSKLRSREALWEDLNYFPRQSPVPTGPVVLAGTRSGWTLRLATHLLEPLPPLRKNTEARKDSQAQRRPARVGRRVSRCGSKSALPLGSLCGPDEIDTHTPAAFLV